MNNKNIVLIVGGLAVIGVGFYLWNKSSKKKEERKIEDEMMRQAMDSAPAPSTNADSGSGMVKSPEQYKAELMANCKNDNGAMQGVRQNLYIPEHEAWSRFGYDPSTEKCQLLGWMSLINTEEKTGKKKWGFTDMADLAQMAAFQLARQKGRA